MRRIIIAFALLLSLPFSALAQDVISNFASDVTVNEDATLTVRETIAVIAQGGDIRHGIFRDFPTRYKDGDGTAVHIDFSVASVERDYHAEPYTLESISNGVRIKIGDKDIVLDQGRHVYTIVYHVNRILGFFPDYDELYWNVTGNGWKFEIQNASVSVHLPAPAAISKTAVYSGFMGLFGKDVQITSQSGSEFAAKTTRSLRPTEGLTVAVDWQKGVIAPPTSAQQNWWLIRDNLGFGVVIATIMAALAYFLWAWSRVGRDPPRGTIVPLFHPPQGFGPSATRYLWKRGFDDKTFAAAVLGLAANGLAKIDEDDGIYTLTKSFGDGAALPQAEKALFGNLGPITSFNQSSNAKIRALMAAVEKNLDAQFGGRLFANNLGWFAVGAILSIAGLALAALLMPDAGGKSALMIAAFCAIWWVFVLGMGWSVIKGFGQARGVFKKIGALLAVVFVVPFLGVGIAVPALTLYGEKWSPVLIALLGGTLLLGILNLVFYVLLPAPSVAGRKILDQIEGLRLYLSTAEQQRLDMLNPPEMTPVVFERYLPYAMALDCENQWNAKFAGVLAAAAVASGTAYAPSFYSSSSGRGWSSSSGSFASDFSSAISSASTPPGSTSGSGGGSSGGGGGGGGGGGW